MSMFGSIKLGKQKIMESLWNSKINDSHEIAWKWKARIE